MRALLPSLCLMALVAGCNQDGLSPANSDGAADAKGTGSGDGQATADAATRSDGSPSTDGSASVDAAIDAAMPPLPDLALPLPDLTVLLDSNPHISLGDGLAPLPPVALHVGVTAPTCCIATHPSGHVLYLTGWDNQGNGTLHLADTQGNDAVLADTVPASGYAFSPDGTQAVFVDATSGASTLPLRMAKVADPSQVATPISTGMQDYPLVYQAYFSPSGNYLLASIVPPNVQESSDLHVVSMASQTDVYQLLNGGADYTQVLTSDDTMIFQNTAGGTSTTSPPVQTLYRLSLPALAQGAAAASLDIHTSTLSLSTDEKTLYYNKTDGSLWSYDLAAAGAPQKVAPSGITFVVSSQKVPAAATVAYLAADLSIHLWAGGADLYATPGKAADFFTPLYFSDDGQYVLFFQNVDTQDNKGDLYALPVTASGSDAPTLIGKGAALSYVGGSDAGDFLFFGNLSAQGDTGDLTSVAAATGLSSTVLGKTVPTTGIAGPTPGNFANLTATHTTANQPIDGSPAIFGELSYSTAPGTVETDLAASVHQSAYELSDDGDVLIYAANSIYNNTATNAVGTLNLFEVSTQRTAKMMGGVSELGPVTARALFVNAPTASPAGVYYVSY